MPQKANPIGSEAVVGLGILAAQHAGALLVAMQGTHERAAGEWQAEWDALPLTCAATAGALAAARAVTGRAGRLPRADAGEPRAEGGSIMAEAAMMAVAGTVGPGGGPRARLRGVLGRAPRGVSLQEALKRVLGPEILEAVGPLADVLDPASYLGETDAIVAAALEGWARGSSGDSPLGGWNSSTVMPSGSLQVEPEAAAIDARCRPRRAGRRTTPPHVESSPRTARPGR